MEKNIGAEGVPHIFKESWPPWYEEWIWSCRKVSNYTHKEDADHPLSDLSQFFKSLASFDY